jgi:hypothetical protein
MARHLLVVHSRPTEGREDDYNRWYDETHLPDVLKVEGFVSAKRFRAQPSIDGGLPEFPYLALYEIEAESLSDALAAVGRAAETMDISDALDRSSMSTYAYTAL